MAVRKVSYSVDHYHILTFSKYYREIVSPYFIHPNLQYLIEDEGTIHESIKLIYNQESFMLQFSKGSMNLIYEGEIGNVKKQNPVCSIFFEIYTSLKQIPGFTSAVRHKITLDAVSIESKERVAEFFEKDNSLYFNPFSIVNEFGLIYEFNENSIIFNFRYGNFSEKDIKKHNLSPLNSAYNEEIRNKEGFMYQCTAIQDVSDVSFSKFKDLLHSCEEKINKFENSKPHGK